MSEGITAASGPSMLKKLLGSRLLSALAYPRSADRYAELASPLWSRGEVRARVTAVRRETSDVVTLVLRPNSSWTRHRAGQYVALTVEVGGALRTRCFSLSSEPSRADGLLEVTVKARAGGQVTPWLVREARPGVVVTLSQPQGDFTLPEPAPGRLLLLSGGSGITPVMAMLRELRARGYRGQVVFVHYARSRADVIFGHELQELGEAEGLRVVVETELEAGARPELTEASLAAIVPDFERWEAWVCGPEPLLAAALRAFAARGAEARLHTERFTLGGGPEQGAEGEAGTVRFRRSGAEAAGERRPLLLLAEQAGLRPKSGCRVGICHSCTCRKVAGVTRDMRTGELSTDADVDIQLCVSEPVGDVTLDL